MDQQRNELAVKRLDTLREIHALTSMALSARVPVHDPGGKYRAGRLTCRWTLARYNAEAAQKEVTRRRAARFPVLSINGFLSGNDGEAYNTDRHIFRSYHEVALVVKFPLLTGRWPTDEAIANVQLERAKKQLAQTQRDMAALWGCAGS
ncbi:MAG: TolC family protein [Desulfobacterales bacterium]|nr:TolC family protein [Desulfobacterales bacterium]